MLLYVCYSCICSSFNCDNNRDYNYKLFLNSIDYNIKKNEVVNFQMTEKIIITISGRETSYSSLFSNLKWLEYFKFNSIYAKSMSKIASMAKMFINCTHLKEIELNFDGVNMFNLSIMNSMFENCASLTKAKISNMDCYKLKSMKCLFKNCTNLEVVELLNINSQQCENISEIFSNCGLLKKVKFLCFRAQNIMNMDQMFWKCHSLEYLDISCFNIRKCTSMKFMFFECNRKLKDTFKYRNSPFKAEAFY